jgi:hypothetical protein
MVLMMMAPITTITNRTEYGRKKERKKERKKTITSKTYFVEFT